MSSMTSAQIYSFLCASWIELSKSTWADQMEQRGRKPIWCALSVLPLDRNRSKQPCETFSIKLTQSTSAIIFWDIKTCFASKRKPRWMLFNGGSTSIPIRPLFNYRHCFLARTLTLFKYFNHTNLRCSSWAVGIVICMRSLSKAARDFFRSTLASAMLASTTAGVGRGVGRPRAVAWWWENVSTQ